MFILNVCTLQLAMCNNIKKRFVNNLLSVCSNELSTEASRISLMKPLDKIYLIFSPRCVTYRQGKRVMGGSIFNYDNFSSLLIKFIGIFQFECIYITVCTGEFSAG